MKKNNVPALILARPGRRRDSLRAFLKVVPQLKIVGQANDGPSALKMIADHHPALMLLDTDLPDDGIWTVLEQIKTRWSQIQCLVLVETAHQQQMAEAAKADGVLVRGFSIAKFLATVERLLTEHKAICLPDTDSRIAPQNGSHSWAD